jgi:hypothetical protein
VLTHDYWERRLTCRYYGATSHFTFYNDLNADADVSKASKSYTQLRMQPEYIVYSTLFIIYLPWVLCLSVCDSMCVCVCVTIAERSAILLVLAIKLTKVTRRRAWRGRDRDGEIGKRQIVEGGYEWTFHCLSQT